MVGETWFRDLTKPPLTRGLWFGLRYNTVVDDTKIKIIEDTISLEELKFIAHDQFINVIKAVVDVEQEIMAVGGEFHSDIETLLLETKNSKRDNTWGINLRLGKTGDEFIEFDSMINLKPLSGNTSRGVEDGALRRKIISIVSQIVKR